MSAPLRLSRDRRIRLGRDFSRLRTQGQRVVSGCLIVNWQELKAPGPSRLGVITSRKVGESVTRSRARRLLRETFRLHQHALKQPVDMVLVARPSIAGKAQAEVAHDYLAALRRARLLKTEA
jgi:ribonuclease P protein component